MKDSIKTIQTILNENKIIYSNLITKLKELIESDSSNNE